MVRVPLDPLEAVGAPHDRRVDLLEDLHVHHGLAVGLAPPLRLPAPHPLRHAVDDVLAVAEDQEVVVDVSGRVEQLEHRLQLALIIGRVLPAAGVPVGVVDVPGPAGRARVAEGRAVGGSGDHGEPFVPARRQGSPQSASLLRRPTHMGPAPARARDLRRAHPLRCGTLLLSRLASASCETQEQSDRRGVAEPGRPRRCRRP